MKQSIRKIIKLIFLILIKEFYLLIKNFLGLIYHPFLTLREIKKAKDKSQALLIISLICFPFFLCLFLTLTGLIIGRFIKLPFINYLKFLALYSDLFTFFIFSLSSLYLFYWSIQVIRKNHFRFF